MHGACVLRASTWKIFVAKVPSFKFIEYFGRDLHFTSAKFDKLVNWFEFVFNSVSLFLFFLSWNSFRQHHHDGGFGIYLHSLCSLKWKLIESSKMRWLIQTFKLPSFCLRFQCLTPKGHCLHHSFLLAEHEIARSFQSHRNLFVYSSLWPQRILDICRCVSSAIHTQTCLCFSCVCLCACRLSTVYLWIVCLSGWVFAITLLCAYLIKKIIPLTWCVCVCVRTKVGVYHGTSLVVSSIAEQAMPVNCSISWYNSVYFSFDNTENGMYGKTCLNMCTRS